MMNWRLIFMVAVMLSVVVFVVPAYANAITGGFIPTGGSTGAGYDNGNFYGYAFQLPTTIINNNPYGGNTGNYSLLNAIAIEHGVVTVVVWFYQPPNGQGALLGFQDAPIPDDPNNNSPFLYVGTNNSLFGGDWLYYAPPPEVITNSLPVGWHMAVIEEYAASSGKFYLRLYLDGKYVGTADLFYPSESILPQLFGSTPNGGYPTYPFGYIGTAYADWPGGNGGYFFYNGTIAVVAFYDALLPSGVISQMWGSSQVMSNGVSIYLPMQNLVVAYVLSPSFFNAGTGTLSPYYANNAALSQLGITNPDLVLVTSGESLKSSIWANYLITVRTTVSTSSTSLFSSAMLFIIVIVVVIIVVLIILLVTMRRKT